MFPLYLKILALNIGASNFVVLLVALARGGTLHSAEFVFPAAIQFLVVTLIFIVLDLVRGRDARAVTAANTPDDRTAQQWMVLKGALRGARPANIQAASMEASSCGAARQNLAKG